MRQDHRPRLYRQYCPLAAALDAVGERWTLLIARELFAGPLGFRDLLRALPGMGSGLLASRLREMESLGLVERAEPARSRGRYRLTGSGRELDAALTALARWGLRRLPELGPEAARRPLWLLQALAAAAGPQDGPDLAVDVAVEVSGPPGDGERHHLLVHAGRVVARRGPHPLPDGAIRTDTATLAALAERRVAAAQALRRGWLRVDSGSLGPARLVRLLTTATVRKEGRHGQSG